MKQERITAILVDTEKEIFGMVNIPNDLETFYKILGCRCIDIVQRRIGAYCKKTFEIICDDEGLFKEPQKISAIDNLGQVQLVGSILIVGNADAKGNLTGLSEHDVKYILSKIQLLVTKKIKNAYPILTQCEYA